MNTYTVITKSCLYTTYIVEAETEAEAREIIETEPSDYYIYESSEDSIIDTIEVASDTGEVL